MIRWQSTSCTNGVGGYSALWTLVKMIDKKYPDVHIYTYLGDYIEFNRDLNMYRCKTCGVAHTSYDAIVAHVGSAHNSEIVAAFLKKFGIVATEDESDPIKVLDTLVEATHHPVVCVKDTSDEHYLGNIYIDSGYGFVKFKMRNSKNEEYTPTLNLKVHAPTFDGVVTGLAQTLKNVEVSCDPRDGCSEARATRTAEVADSILALTADTLVAGMRSDTLGQARTRVTHKVANVAVAITALTLNR